MFLHYNLPLNYNSETEKGIEWKYRLERTRLDRLLFNLLLFVTNDD